MPIEAPAAPASCIGVVGLGLMGSALCERLLEHGYRVLVWNRTPAKADPLISRGAEWCDNPPARCQRFLICLYTTDVVELVLGQMRDGLHPGQIVVDTTTGDPDRIVALGVQLGSRGIHYLDAPISGSSEQARRGEAVVIVGGDRESFESCADLWAVIGEKVIHAGPCGSGSKMKLISNLVLGLNRAALAEGLAFAEAIGVESAAALEVLRASMAYSRAMDVKGRKMVQSDFSVQARLSQHLKDVRLILKAAAAADIALPLSQTHRKLLEQAESAGLGDLDNSAIVDILRKSRREKQS